VNHNFFLRRLPAESAENGRRFTIDQTFLEKEKDLMGHPNAKRAYAWTYRDSAQNKTVAVLEIPPVDSPQSAVKVAMAALGRQSK
jgi:hypothetical protein